MVIDVKVLKVNFTI